MKAQVPLELLILIGGIFIVGIIGGTLFFSIQETTECEVYTGWGTFQRTLGAIDYQPGQGCAAYHPSSGNCDGCDCRRLLGDVDGDGVLTGFGDSEDSQNTDKWYFSNTEWFNDYAGKSCCADIDNDGSVSNLDGLLAQNIYKCTNREITYFGLSCEKIGMESNPFHSLNTCPVNHDNRDYQEISCEQALNIFENGRC